MLFLIRKLFLLLATPRCWIGLRYGVGAGIEHREVIRLTKPDLLLDAGANKGQFSLATRSVFPDTQIIAFEPLESAGKKFRKVLGTQGVSLHQVALGAEQGQCVLHVSNRPDSSSLLEIGTQQNEIFPGTSESEQITCSVWPLDELVPNNVLTSQTLLKIDVQGFELELLKGAEQTLSSIGWIYVECSHIELYTGQPHAQEVFQFLQERGWKQVGIYNAVEKHGIGLVQADYLFRNQSLSER